MFGTGWVMNVIYMALLKQSYWLIAWSLGRGIYPSEVLPHKVESPASTQYTFSEPLLNDIRTAVGNLDAGYSRILRVCRCVSEVVQRSSSRQ